MSNPFLRSIALLCALIAAASSSRETKAQDVAKLEQQAFTAAVESVADCVVQIRTIGGLDQLDGETLAQGPTTGLILTADGYIVSSAINFATQPASILVRLPSGDQTPATLVGHDTNRMLVLLKVEADEPLPVPPAAPLNDVRVGDWAVAVGRTYDANRVNVSVGVVSALGRMHGRAIQCDANASASNYGGPLVDVRGRVLGVLVPMAPQAAGAAETSETAGAEFYDSGIAFAVPLDKIRATLDRWIDAKDLKRGLLGVGMSEGNPHTTPPKVTAVWPRSPAAEAGWKAGDVIVAVDGVPVETQTQLRFQVAPHYAGDSLAVTVRRPSAAKGDDDGPAKSDELETQITLAAKLEPYRHPFLGILPARTHSSAAASRGVPAPGASEAESPPTDDDKADEEDAAKAPPTAGLAIRTVWPGSPAAVAGLRAGDIITHLGEAEIESRDAALAALASQNPGDKLTVTATRGDEKLELDVELAELPTDVLTTADLPALPAEDVASDAGGETKPGDEGETAEDAEIELDTLKLPDLPQEARYYQPPGNRPDPSVLIWLADGDEQHNQELASAWRSVCDERNIILVMPAPADAKGWSADDMEFLGRLLPAALTRLGADPTRLVVGGEGKGGQLAYVLAFKGRKWIRGAAVADVPLPRTLELPSNAPGQRLAIASVETQNAPLTLLIHQDLRKLAEAGYPASQLIRTTPPTGDGQLDAPTRAAIGRWIEALDRF